MRFSGLNIVDDEEGYDYPIDNEGRIYVPLDSQTVSETEYLENTEKRTKNYNDSALVCPLLVPQSALLMQNHTKI